FDRFDGRLRLRFAIATPLPLLIHAAHGRVADPALARLFAIDVDRHTPSVELREPGSSQLLRHLARLAAAQPEQRAETSRLLSPAQPPEMFVRHAECVGESPEMKLLRLRQ